MSADLLTTTEVAARLGRSRWYVQALLADGLLATVQRPGGRRFVTAASLEAWLQSGSPDPGGAGKLPVFPGVVKIRGRGA